MSYNSFRMLSGTLSMFCAVSMIIMAVWMLWRGGKERPRWKPIPGRIVLGLAILFYASTRVEENIWKITVRGSPGPVGRHVNDSNTVIFLAIAAVFFTWSIVRFLRNDLESRSTNE